MNLGGYTKNDFNESKGNSILKEFLHNENLIFTHFSEQDKTPNFDGYFEILENSGLPIGRFNVQIKTMNHNYLNENKKYNKSKYKYSCETKIFNAVKNSITLNPCILFIVDSNKRKIFVKFVSFEFALSLNINNEIKKTIYFDDKDEVTDILKFYEKAKKVYLDRKKQLSNLEENKFSINEELTYSELIMLQKEFDYLNNIFDSDLLYLKNKFFPNTWKFGLAYLKKENSIGLGIYLICKGENGKYFKKLSKDILNDCTYLLVSYTNKNIIHKMINDFLRSILEESYKENIISINKVTDGILFEIAFYFLDKISSISKSLENRNKVHIYYKDSEYVDVLDSYFSALVQYAYETRKNIIKKSKIDKIQSNLYCDPLEEICFGKNMEEIEEKRKILDYLFTHPNKREKFDQVVILSGTFNYLIIKDAIEELKKRKISIVRRVWKPRDWGSSLKKLKKKNFDRIESGYLTNDYLDNFKKLITDIPYNYDYYTKNVLGVEIKAKYVFGFSVDKIEVVTSLYFENENFITEINDQMVKRSQGNELDLMKEMGAKSIRHGFCQAFNLEFPMLTHINYLFIKQIGKKYNIEKIDLENIDICL